MQQVQFPDSDVGDNGVSVVGHVIRVQGLSIGYLSPDILDNCSLHPLFNMSFSDQHPYTLFIAGGLRSPPLAKA